jgi:hypothetical protein
MSEDKKENYCARCLNSIGESDGVVGISNYKTGKIIYKGDGICGVCSSKIWKEAKSNE